MKISRLILITILLFFVCGCNTPSKDIEKLQKKYHDVYQIPNSYYYQYVVADERGDIHLITNNLQTDIIIFYAADIENNLKWEFKKADMSN